MLLAFLQKREWKGRKCKRCNRPLVAIGRHRKNGDKRYDDWKDRPYHKKCVPLPSQNQEAMSRPSVMSNASSQSSTNTPTKFPGFLSNVPISKKRKTHEMVN